MFKFDGVPPISYQEYHIPKKSKGVRIIEEPNAQLKAVQKNILQYMYQCTREGRLPVSYMAHGFVPHRGCMTAVPMHSLRSPVMVGLDIHDFFLNFPKENVEENLSFGMQAPMVNFIMQCALWKGSFPKEHFPQGSPISPYLTNVGMFPVDRMIASFSKKNGIFFTRYADDMLFSIIDGAEDSPQVRKLMHEDEPFSSLVHGVETILQDHLGLELAKDKTHVMWRYSTCKSQALGITFRQDCKGYNANKKKRRNTRAQLHNLFRKVQAQGGHFEIEDWKEWQSVNGSMNYCNLVRSLSKFPEVAGIDPIFQLSYYNEIERWANASV